MTKAIKNLDVDLTKEQALKAAQEIYKNNQDECDNITVNIYCESTNEKPYYITYGHYQSGAERTLNIKKFLEENAHFELKIDNAPNIKFVGARIGSASTGNAQQSNRWTELDLYKTKSGKYVCHQIGRTVFPGERDFFSGCVCETLDQVFDFFGHGWLAKELYASANIEDTVKVD